MNVFALSLRNLARDRSRTALTVASVAVAVVALLLLRTAISAWSIGAERAPKNRLLTRNSVAYELGLPSKYVERVKAVPGVSAVSWLNWFGGKDPAHQSLSISSYACDPSTFLTLYDGVTVSQADQERWTHDRTGALVGSALAERMGWKVGQHVTLNGTIYPGDWDFTIDAIYQIKNPVADPGLFLFHWKYLNELRPTHMHDRVEYVWSRVDDPTRAAEISKAIDRAFEVEDTATRTEDERSFFASMLGMVSTALGALDVLSVIVLLIMALLLRNTLAMAVGERSVEYATLRALGFSARRIWLIVCIEALMLGAFAGAFGIALAYPLVDLTVGRWVEANVAALIPEFRMQPLSVALASFAAVVLSCLVAIPQALAMTSTRVVDGLRRVG
ncbi:MAG TPA: FtsX-like permease family protein [Polyangiaceae bacterium]|nr:FtsX-like permease family protein [Polyangiaceae bacterium]